MSAVHVHRFDPAVVGCARDASIAIPSPNLRESSFAGRVIPRLTESDFHRIVQSLRSVSDPAAIILFGSYARGDVHDYSDVDLLVLRRRGYSAGESRRKELGYLYRSVTDVCEAPKDIILFTLDEFYSWRDTTNHMVAVAWKEGRLLYGQV